MSGPEPLPIPRGDGLKRGFQAFLAEIGKKVQGVQGGVPTFADNFLLHLARELKKIDGPQAWEQRSRQVPGPYGQWLQSQVVRLQCLLARRAQGRFVPLAERGRLMQSQEARQVHVPGPGSEIAPDAMVMSQGAVESMSWRGMPLFKTAFDLALYPMLLWELRPRTILEIGAGTGASALWMSDLLRALDLPCRILSLDIKKPALELPGVTFIEGDCHRIAEALPEALLREAAHPWLVVEDAHENVEGVLAYLDGFMVPGDYLAVEDSEMKRQELQALFGAAGSPYRVDTRFTDFFGRNATASVDSIFRKF